jgi:DHA3 family macrolide efflux protein-like MFS transporter
VILTLLKLSRRFDLAAPYSAAEDNNWKRSFFTIWGGQAFSLLGSRLVQFALIWYLTEKTGSATVLATASMVGLLPNVFLSPFIGALVDRWDRRRIMIIADSAIALATVLLAVLFALDVIQIWHIYALMFVRAVGGGFHGPAMIASTSLMVPNEHLTRIQGVNQTLNGGLNIISAPLGALLLEILPTQTILGIDVFTAAFAILPLFFIPIPQPERKPAVEGGKPSVLKEMHAGFQYIISWPGLLFIVVMATMINFLLSPAFSLLPLLVKEHFGGGAIQLGWANAGFGAGVIAGGLLLGVWGGFKRRIVTSLMGVIGIGIGSLIIGLIPASAFSIAIGALVLAGIMQPIANGSLGAILQASVAPEMQGRVFTLLGSAATAMIPIGLAIAGPLSDRFGIQIWFIIGGVICLLMGVLQFFIPAVMGVESQMGQSNVAEEALSDN